MIYYLGPLMYVTTIPFAIILGLWAAYYALTVFLNYLGLLTRFVEWVKRENVVLHSDGVMAEQRLAALGFELAGVAKYTQLFSRKPRYIFVYTDAKHIILAELDPNIIASSFSYSLAFKTYFKDLLVINTRYPVGENISSRGLTIRRCSESIETAYEEHMDEVSKSVSLTEVSPIQFHTLSSIRDADKLYGRLYKNRQNRTDYLRRLAQAVCLGVNAFTWWVFSSMVYPLTEDRLKLWTVILFLSSIGMFVVSTFDATKPRGYEKGKRKKMADE